MYVIMTASAHMPSSCRGRYRRVAVVEVMSYDFNRGNSPKRIDGRDRRIFRIIDLGKHSVGKTERCAYARALKQAEALAHRLNNAGDIATAQDIIGAGGSA